MKISILAIAKSLILLAVTTTVHAQEARTSYPVADAGTEHTVIIRGARIFDGTGRELIDGRDVLVRGNRIAEIASSIGLPPGTTVIEAEGRVLMPGLTDSHTHLMMQNISLAAGMRRGLDYLSHVAAGAAEDMLMRGFTSVRDAGGPVFGLKRAIDEGLIPGPRIYPSGPLIGQTSGHSDFRNPKDIPAEIGVLTAEERDGFALIADGVPEVRKRAREVLRMGATQLKVMAGGGVSSDYDPLDVRQYSKAEMEAVVDAAEAWNTYVMVHAYTPKAVQAALEAGVKCIEHGQMMDEDTAKMIAKNGAWLSIQPFLDDGDRIRFPEGSPNREKQLRMVQGTPTAYELARKYKIKTAFSTDTLFSAELAKRQGAQLAKLKRWYEPWEILQMATSRNFELFKLAGPRDPYPGPNGVVAEGAYADLLLVDGNPLEDIDLVADPAQSFVVIMKDGVIYKNTL